MNGKMGKPKTFSESLVMMKPEQNRKTLKRALDGTNIHPHSPMFTTAASSLIKEKYGTDWNHILQTPLIVNDRTSATQIKHDCRNSPKLISFYRSLEVFLDQFPACSKSLTWLSSCYGSVFWIRQIKDNCWVYDWDYLNQQETDFFKTGGMTVAQALKALGEDLSASGIRIRYVFDSRKNEDCAYIHLPDGGEVPDQWKSLFVAERNPLGGTDILPFVHTLDYLQQYLAIVPHSLK